MLTLSAHPDTLEKVESSVLDWFGKIPEGQEMPVSFSRASRFSNRLCLFSSPAADFKLEMKEQCVLFQVKNRRLSLNLDKFLITTAFEDERLCLNIERDPKPEHRFLSTVLRDLADTKYPAFLARVLRVVKSLEEDLPNTRIDEATAEPNDFLVILDALSASPMVSQLISDDPFLAAKMRGLKRKQQMLSETGGVLSSEQVADILGITRQAVDKRRGSNQILALTQGKRGYSYPSFQFDDGKTLKGLEGVLEGLRSLDPWMQLAFFASPNDHLDGNTPIKALRSGHVERVMRAASAYGEQGAA